MARDLSRLTSHIPAAPLPAFGATRSAHCHRAFWDTVWCARDPIRSPIHGRARLTSSWPLDARITLIWRAIVAVADAGLDRLGVSLAQRSRVDLS
jgi:hypothetical protein